MIDESQTSFNTVLSLIVDNFAEVMAEIRKEFYHGWMIRVIQKQVGYTFQCWTSERLIDVTDTQQYSTIEYALCAGRARADLESVRLSLTSFLRGRLQLLLLNSDERNALEDSIAQYINTAKSEFR